MALNENFHTTDPQLASAINAVLQIQNWVKTNIDLDLGLLRGEFRGDYLYRWSLCNGGIRMWAGCGSPFAYPADKDDCELRHGDYVLVDGTYFEDDWNSKHLWAFVDHWKSIKAQIMERYNVVKGRQSFVA